MYIEFDILASDIDFDALEQSVRSWAEKYQTPFTTKVAKGLKYRLAFNYPEHYSLFFVTWQGSEYKIKNPSRY